MITDAEFLFSDAQDISQVAAAYDSTNVYDTRGGKTTPDNTSSLWGAGADIFGVLIIDEAVVGTSSTVQFQFVSSADTGLGTPTVHWDSGAIAEATLTLGYTMAFRLPPLDTYLRYLGFIYTIGTATTTAGTVTALLTPHLDIRKAYASGLTFS